jgi:hypothetical protein
VLEEVLRGRYRCAWLAVSHPHQASCARLRRLGRVALRFVCVFICLSLMSCRQPLLRPRRMKMPRPMHLLHGYLPYARKGC